MLPIFKNARLGLEPGTSTNWKMETTGFAEPTLLTTGTTIAHAPETVGSAKNVNPTGTPEGRAGHVPKVGVGVDVVASGNRTWLDAVSVICSRFKYTGRAASVAALEMETHVPELQIGNVALVQPPASMQLTQPVDVQYNGDGQGAGPFGSVQEAHTPEVHTTPGGQSDCLPQPATQNRAAQ